MSEFRKHYGQYRPEETNIDSISNRKSSESVYDNDKNMDAADDNKSSDLKNIDPFENLGMTIYIY